MQMLQFSFGCLFTAIVGFHCLFIWRFCFEATMIGGYIPFVVLGLAVPLGSFMIGGIVASLNK